MAILEAIQPMGVHAGPDTRPVLDWEECKPTLGWFAFLNALFVTAVWCCILCVPSLKISPAEAAQRTRRRRQASWRLVVSWWIPVFVFLAAVVCGYLRNDHPTCARPEKVNYVIVPEGISLSINFWISRYGDFTGPLLLLTFRLGSYLMQCSSTTAVGKDVMDVLLGFPNLERIMALVNMPAVKLMLGIICWRIFSYLIVRKCHCFISDHLYFVASVLAQVLIVAYEEDMAHENVSTGEVKEDFGWKPYTTFVCFCCFVVGVLFSIESFVTATHFHTPLADVFGAGLGLFTFVSISFCHIEVAPRLAAKIVDYNTDLTDPLVPEKASE